ncbi:peptidoglycan DD-metalloendopeptidase family protein [Piscinibacter sp.]|uniref:peptidoglycan DD-metalloendopeptidase family protein n=1 Tax=Piscinibacter sp. TaxID=1903157 RepID=UPI001B52CD1A|nr:peptidoglycan DD-metalloendopeptidase family protein [Piscinibacter sp.]MBP5990694.1 peptidoglycan DD-metalloendopeptidase family protein [Piscinibacter sp.]MBP6028834.1 peptidoglycan DD-metalloendopeptidase family protein [Piscinibacter sp.]
MIEATVNSLSKRHFEHLAAALCAAALLGGCATSKNPAPVEERALGPRATPLIVAGPGTAPALPASDTSKPLPGAENAGKPGYYTVKPGDTMIRVGLESGQNWKDLVKWNNLENANVIEVGQVLRVVPPGENASGVSTRPITVSKAETRPLDAKPAPTAASSAPAAAPAPAPAPVAAVREGDDDINWMWPAAGPVSSVFEEGKSKGLGISGKPGDPVLAAADGRVVYAGSGLRGYGNLVILKHNATYLTAYAHNQTLLVKEDQAVKRGQKIAEMGNTDSDRVLLHFEIRKQGKPVDPARLLPPR